MIYHYQEGTYNAWWDNSRSLLIFLSLHNRHCLITSWELEDKWSRPIVYMVRYPAHSCQHVNDLHAFSNRRFERFWCATVDNNMRYDSNNKTNAWNWTYDGVGVAAEAAASPSWSIDSSGITVAAETKEDLKEICESPCHGTKSPIIFTLHWWMGCHLNYWCWVR